MTVGRVAVEPVTLDFNGVRLEPLSLDHVDGLRAAAAEGAFNATSEEDAYRRSVKWFSHCMYVIARYGDYPH